MKLRYVILATLLAPLLTHADKDNGVSLFEQHCASCHGQQTDDRIPTRANLSFMNPLALLAAMETGSMRVQASALNANEKRALAEGVTGKELADLTMPQQAFCEADHAPVDQHSTVHWSGWGGDKQGSGHARQPLAGLTRQDLASLRLAWAFAFPGASQARSQPAVLDDVVYVGGAEGSVTALDAFTGCIYWRIDTTSAVRGAMVVAKIGERYAVLAVARSTEVYAIDAATGNATRVSLERPVSGGFVWEQVENGEVRPQALLYGQGDSIAQFVDLTNFERQGTGAVRALQLGDRVAGVEPIGDSGSLRAVARHATGFGLDVIDLEGRRVAPIPSTVNLQEFVIAGDMLFTVSESVDRLLAVDLTTQAPAEITMMAGAAHVVASTDGGTLLVDHGRVSGWYSLFNTATFQDGPADQRVGVRFEGLLDEGIEQEVQ